MCERGVGGKRGFVVLFSFPSFVGTESFPCLHDDERRLSIKVNDQISSGTFFEAGGKKTIRFPMPSKKVFKPPKPHPTPRIPFLNLSFSSHLSRYPISSKTRSYCGYVLAHKHKLKNKNLRSLLSHSSETSCRKKQTPKQTEPVKAQRSVN